jgi:hypothetical protein
MKRNRLLAVIIMFCLPLVSHPASAEEFELDDNLMLDFRPSSLTLRPFEEGEILLLFRNNREEAVTIFVEVDDSNYTMTADVVITPELLEIDQGDTGTVTVLVTSRSNIFRSGDAGVLLSIAWGPDLFFTGQSVDPSTVEGSDSYYLTVTDDYYASNPYYMGSFIIAVSSIFVLIIVWFIKFRRRHTTDKMELS